MDFYSSLFVLEWTPEKLLREWNAESVAAKGQQSPSVQQHISGTKNTRYGNLLCCAQIWEQDAFICDLNHHLWKSNLWKSASIKHFTNALQRRGQTLPVNLYFFSERCNSATQRTGSRKKGKRWWWSEDLKVLMQKQGNCNTLHRLHVKPSSDTSALSSIITFLGRKVSWFSHRCEAAYNHFSFDSETTVSSQRPQIGSSHFS